MPMTPRPIVVDLCPKKPDPKVLEVGNTKLTVELQVTSKKPVPSVVLKRLEDKAAKPVLDQYQKVVQQEVLVLAQKITELAKKGDEAGVKKMTAETQLSVQNACKALQSAVNVAVTKQLQQDAKADRDLLEAQVVVVLKGALITLKVGIAVAKLAVSSGGDVTAYVSLAQNVIAMIRLVAEALKSELDVRKELGQALDAHLRATAADRTKTGPKVVEVLKKHQQKVTALRQSLVKLSARADDMVKQMRAAKDLKNGVRLGARAMDMQRNVKVEYEQFTMVEKIGERLIETAKRNGITPDDRDLVQRLKDLSPQDAIKAIKEAKDIVEDIIKLVQT